VARWYAPFALLIAFGCSQDEIEPPTDDEVTVRISVIGDGRVTSKALAIDCDGDCEEKLARNTTVLLTAVSLDGAVFLGWSGACEGIGECSLTASRDAGVTATFGSAGVELEVRVEGPGLVASDTDFSCGDLCVMELRRGDEVELSAHPASNSRFVGWSGVCTGAGACVVAIDRSTSVLAIFVDDPPDQIVATVTVEVVGPGSVESGGVSCSGSCPFEVEVGTSITLTAIPDPNSIFVGWTGACSDASDPTCVLLVRESVSVVATFEPDVGPGPVLDVTVVGDGRVMSTPQGIDCPDGACFASFPPGSMVALQPAPSDASAFWRWEGACQGSGACEVDLTADTSVTAVFGSACNQRSVNAGQGFMVALDHPAMDVSAMTIEAWILNSAGLSGVLAERMDRGAGQCQFRLSVGTGEVTFCVYSGCTSTAVDEKCIDLVMDDIVPTWRHIAATYSPPGAIDIYVDGVPAAIDGWMNGNFTGILANTDDDFESYLPTYIASLRMNETVLYNGMFVPDTAPPPLPTDVLNWQIEEGSGSMLGDSSLTGIVGTMNSPAWQNIGPGCP
jgi:hypothetical protein